MGHGSTPSDPWPMWPIRFSWPIWPMTHRPIPCSGYYASYLYQAWSSQELSFESYCTFPVTMLCDNVTLTFKPFDRATYHAISICYFAGTTLPPSLKTIWPSVYYLSPNSMKSILSETCLWSPTSRRSALLKHVGDLVGDTFQAGLKQVFDKIRSIICLSMKSYCLSFVCAVRCRC